MSFTQVAIIVGNSYIKNVCNDQLSTDVTIVCDDGKQNEAHI